MFLLMKYCLFMIVKTVQPVKKACACAAALFKEGNAKYRVDSVQNIAYLVDRFSFHGGGKIWL